MERVLVPIYLKELYESVSLCERCMLGLDLGIITENDHKAKQYSYVIINFETHSVSLMLCEDFKIQVTQSNVGMLPKLYDYINRNSNLITDISSIKKLSLTYIQGLG